MDKFASWRLGKTSVEDIHRMNKLPLGLQKDLPRFNVKCTQVPQEFTVGTYVFIWLGSDNNKGIPTDWKQGFKAIGRLVHINRGEKFGDESTSVIEVTYIFPEVFNRIDILRDAPISYYWCSSFPIIGLDDHSNQTIRMFSESDERSNIGAFFEILKALLTNFTEDALKINPQWTELLKYSSPDPKLALLEETTNYAPHSFQSSDLKEFWNEIGQIVISVDEDFSKLPRYYHKGHIRVKTNYGGAVNFSLGFYDKDSERVNAGISFNYNERTDTDGEHVFYLNTDIKDATAFEKFIPVFNETYQGLFEISKIGHTYTFTDFRNKTVEPFKSKRPRQVIYFGAPGTGKSHAVNKVIKEEAPRRNVRTTFHPDTDYSSFVGCFKPTMKDGQIQYAFTAQAFINAYVGAWSDLSKPFYLVIEEINRGNCAQILGDIFQLLDRNVKGESSYAIKPDTDLQAYLADKLCLLANIPDEIRSGEEMRLPSNLFIYATMNTSDQSLFPIDSAFKRRWDWRYTAIKPGENDHTLVVGGHRYNWTSFIKNVNKKIFELTKSEDKQLGYWFIKPNDFGEIDWELFVSKAIFYIWNDVVKDYATMEKEDSPFGKKFAFTTFFDEDGNPLIEQVVSFLEALDVKKLAIVADEDIDSTIETDREDNDSSDENVDDLNEVSSQVKVTGSKYSYVLDGENFSGIGKAIIAIINKLSENFTFDEIADSFNRIVKKTYKKESAIKAQHPSKLNPDENGRNRWYVKPFKDKDGKEFSLISLWPDSYFDRIKAWVESYQEIFPQGFIQILNTISTDE